MRKEPFDIPTINNHKEALAIFLGIDSNIVSVHETDFDRIEDAGITGNLGSQIHTFRFEDCQYFVGSKNTGLKGDELITFNSSLWQVLKFNSDTPYCRFNDKTVMNHLQTLITNQQQVVDIDQPQQTITIKSGDIYSEWRYASHVPEDISSYYLVGLLTTITCY
ncbi:hypothetical protein A1QO_02705 [Vibrio genomosp. F10 str. ZF-129]|uniref:Uncharacterized protein n=1 Tax=Vibrio genomosp. F10 str. ZF-129 TaxID=1187848 RepID=A0A1E5BK74_9VIBR|nr:hypothetical protein [Vibrio genomosp. F10]OEE38308.1 hypothetical protein A1QO_02705 [Vibrio genomosp. F10 str. ZF-129]